MTTPAEHIAAAIYDACDIEHVFAYKPATLTAKTAFVSPADPWKETGERFVGFTTGLEAHLVVGLTDQEQALAWLDAQTTALLEMDPVDVDTDEVIAGPIGAPFVFANADGSQFLTCRITFSRFQE